MTEPILLYGRHVLKEALAIGAPIHRIFYEGARAIELINRAQQKLTDRIELKEGIPARLKKKPHQGLVFECSHPFYKTFRPELFNRTDFVVICNGVEDVQNLGSIVRSGVAFGAGVLLHEEKGSAELTPAAIKSSAGLAFRMKFVKVGDWNQALPALKAFGFKIAGLDAHTQSAPISNWKPEGPVALVLGSEDQGLSASVQKYCDQLLHIPMSSKAESLNVGHAAAIAFQTLYARRASMT